MVAAVAAVQSFPSRLHVLHGGASTPGCGENLCKALWASRTLSLLLAGAPAEEATKTWRRR